MTPKHAIGKFWEVAQECATSCAFELKWIVLSGGLLRG